MPYSNPVQSLQPFKREGKFILPKLFSYYVFYIDFSYLESEEEDQVESVFEIEDEVQLDLDTDKVPTPNPNPKWAQKFIEAARNMIGYSSEKRRTRS